MPTPAGSGGPGLAGSLLLQAAGSAEQLPSAAAAALAELWAAQLAQQQPAAPQAAGTPLPSTAGLPAGRPPPMVPSPFAATDAGLVDASTGLAAARITAGLPADQGAPPVAGVPLTVAYLAQHNAQALAGAAAQPQQRQQQQQLAVPRALTPASDAGTVAGSVAAGDADAAAVAPVRKKIKFIQPVSAAWEREASGGGTPGARPTGSSGSEAATTAGAASPPSAPAPVPAPSAGGGKRKRAAAAADKPPPLQARAQLPPPLAPALAVAASAGGRAQPAQWGLAVPAAGLPLPPAPVQGLAVQAALSAPSPAPLAGVPGLAAPLCPVPRLVVAAPPKSVQLSGSHESGNRAAKPSPALASGGANGKRESNVDVHARLGELYNNFVSARDVYLTQALQLMERVSKGSTAAATPAMLQAEKAREMAAVQRALDKAVQIIQANSSAAAAAAKQQRRRSAQAEAAAALPVF